MGHKSIGLASVHDPVLRLQNKSRTKLLTSVFVVILLIRIPLRCDDNANPFVDKEKKNARNTNC